MAKAEATTEGTQQVRNHRRITVTINRQTHLQLLKQAEQEGKPLSQVIAATIEKQLIADLPTTQDSRRITISLSENTHSALLQRKTEERRSLSGLVSLMLDSAISEPTPDSA